MAKELIKNCEVNKRSSWDYQAKQGDSRAHAPKQDAVLPMKLKFYNF